MDSKIVTENIDLEKALHIRSEVFIKEQGVPVEIEVDEFDTINDICQHVLVFYKDKAVGTGRLRVIGDIGKLERICILKDYRKFGLGQILINSLEKVAKDKGIVKVKLNSQTHAEKFYYKLGYATNSEIFMEDNIPHILMTKDI